MQNENVFSTRDLALAAVLVTMKFFCTGVHIEYTGTKNQPVGYFTFERSKEIEDCRSRFLQGMLVVEPKLFLSNLHAMKAMVVNAVSNPLDGTKR